MCFSYCLLFGSQRGIEQRVQKKKAKQWNTMPESVNDVKNLARTLQNYNQYVIQEEKVRWTLRIVDAIDVCSK